MHDDMDEEDWEPMPSVVGIPLPDEDVVDSDGAPERVSEEPEALSGEDLMEAELDEAELEVDELQWVSGVPLPEPPPPLPAAARALAPPPPVPFTPSAQSAPRSAGGRSSFVDLDELLEEVIRDDSTRPVPFVPRPDLSTAETPHARRWPYALAALAAGAVVAYGVSTVQAPSPERASAATPPSATTSRTEAYRPAHGATPQRDVAPEATRELAPATAPVAQEPVAQNTTETPVRAAEPRRTRTGQPRPSRRARPTRPTPPAAARTAPSRPTPRRQAPDRAPVVQTSPAPVAAPTPAAPESREDLPETPTRAQVQAAFTRVLPNLRACTDSRGAVPIRVTISGSGRITTAVVQGHFAGTPEGSCLARAVRTAHLPAFQQRRLNVNYPFVL